MEDSPDRFIESLNVITEEALLELTEWQTLDKILVISLRNKELHVYLKLLSYCKNLRIAYCQGNQLIPKELDYLGHFEWLQKLDLSDNGITQLPSKDVFENLPSLQILFLHMNKISKWEDLESLVGLSHVLHLTLYWNPVAGVPGYRHFLVNSISK